MFQSIRKSIAQIIQFVNTPETIGLLIKTGTDQLIKEKKEDHFRIRHNITHHWTNLFNHRKLSKYSRQYVKEVFNDSNKNINARELAFELWLADVTNDELAVLQAINSDSPLYERAVFERARLRDLTITPALCHLLAKDSRHFVHASYVWCDQVKKHADYYLAGFKNEIPDDFTGGKLNSHYALAELLSRIPTKDAEELLMKYWEHLRFSRLFVQAALYIGTPKCLELADSSIKQCPSEIDFFEHFSIYFGFSDISKTHLVQNKIDNLIPYLNRFSDQLVNELALFCQNHGLSDWMTENLKERLNRESKRLYFPTNNDLLEDLRKAGDIWRVSSWLQNFDERGDKRERVLEILNEWFTSYKDQDNFNRRVPGYEHAANCLRIMGKREDLRILDKYVSLQENSSNANFEKDMIADIRKDVDFEVKWRSLT